MFRLSFTDTLITPIRESNRRQVSMKYCLETWTSELKFSMLLSSLNVSVSLSSLALLHLVLHLVLFCNPVPSLAILFHHFPPSIFFPFSHPPFIIFHLFLILFSPHQPPPPPLSSSSFSLAYCVSMTHLPPHRPPRLWVSPPNRSSFCRKAVLPGWKTPQRKEQQQAPSPYLSQA